MRILVFADQFGSISTTFIYNEVIELSKEHEVLFVCGERLNEDIFPFQNVKIIKYKLNPILKKIRWWQEIYDVKLNFANSSYKKQLKKVVTEFQPDIFHCHFGYEALKVLQNIYSGSAPIVISFRGYDASQMLRRNSYVKEIRKFLEKENVYPTFVCNYLKNNLVQKKIPVGDHLILYSGTDTDFFNRDGNAVKSEKFTFLQISGFGDKKGHKYTVDAYAKLIAENANHNTQLILAGEGKNLEKIKKQVQELGIQNEVYFPGKVDKNEAKKLLAKANCFVHHSVTAENGDTEGIPNALMEAMSMQIPVLSTKHAGIPELVEDGIHGYLVKEGDVESYFEKMKSILQWSYKQENREKILKLFNKNRHMNLLMDFYSKISNKNNG